MGLRHIEKGARKSLMDCCCNTGITVCWTSLFMKSGIDASGIDLFLYKMSGASLFFDLLIGLLIESWMSSMLKKNIPL